MLSRIGRAKPLDIGQLPNHRRFERWDGIGVMLHLYTEALRDVVIVRLGDHHVVSVDAPGLELSLGHDAARSAIDTNRHASSASAVVAQVRGNRNPVNRLPTRGASNAR